MSEMLVDSAHQLTATAPQSTLETVVAAARLHEIGYSSQLRKTGLHPLDGFVTEPTRRTSAPTPSADAGSSSDG